MNNSIINHLFNLIYINKLLLLSYKLNSDEFDNINDKISYLYHKLKQKSGLSFVQIDRILNNLHKHETKC